MYDNDKLYKKNSKDNTVPILLYIRLGLND